MIFENAVDSREHYQWNMDVWGVSGVEAEAELLSAIVASFKSMGLTAKDVGIKVSKLCVSTLSQASSANACDYSHLSTCADQ